MRRLITMLGFVLGLFAFSAATPSTAEAQFGCYVCISAQPYPGYYCSTPEYGFGSIYCVTGISGGTFYCHQFFLCGYTYQDCDNAKPLTDDEKQMVFDWTNEGRIAEAYEFLENRRATYSMDQYVEKTNGEHELYVPDFFNSRGSRGLRK